MADFTRLFLLAGPLFLLGLTAIAGYAYSQIRYLSLPIPEALALFTVVLPLITGITTQGVYGLIKQSSKNDQYVLTIPLIAVIFFQLIYETIVATLALTHIIPPSTLNCGLNDKWLKLFRQKDRKAITSVQDTFNCCGLNSVVDRAFPFGNPSTCATDYGRTQSCFGDWRKAEQINAGLLLLVALVVFILKVFSIITLLTSASSTYSRWVGPFKKITSRRLGDEENSRASTRRLIGPSDGEERYRDEPEDNSPPNTNGSEDVAPRILPSQLGETHNKWAAGDDDDEQSQRDTRLSH